MDACFISWLNRISLTILLLKLQYVDDDDSSQGDHGGGDSFDYPFGDAFNKKAMEYAEVAAPAGEPSFEGRRRSMEDNDRRRRYV